MKKQQIIILIALLVVAGFIYKFTNLGRTLGNSSQTSETQTSQTETTPNPPVATSTPKIETVKPVDQKTQTINAAWDVLQKYLAAAKVHDLKTVTSLSYQISPTCTDSKQIEQCNKLMESVYLYGRDMKKSDYKNAWYDNKQIILSTDEIKIATTTVHGIIKGFIYFTKDDAGNIKFLSLNPEDGAYEMTKDKTPEQVDADLEAMIKDTDQDGLADKIETCTDSIDSTCVKTDPNKRDTNGNGWWDGIEHFFYKKP